MMCKCTLYSKALQQDEENFSGFERLLQDALASERVARR